MTTEKRFPVEVLLRSGARFQLNVPDPVELLTRVVETIRMAKQGGQAFWSDGVSLIDATQIAALVPGSSEPWPVADFQHLRRD